VVHPHPDIGGDKAYLLFIPKTKTVQELLRILGTLGVRRERILVASYGA